MAGPAFDNLEVLGRRLNRLIKYSETMLKKTDKDDHDSKSRYISNIISLTKEIIDVKKLNDSYQEIEKWFSALKIDKINENKKAVRAMSQETQDNSMDELLSKRQAKEMKSL